MSQNTTPDTSLARDQAPGDPAKQAKAAAWFRDLRDQITAQFEAIEREWAQRHGGTPGTFTFSPWDRPDGGGGVIGKMNGQVFEKVGVNVSEVWGKFKPEFAGSIRGADQDPRFWASGVSLVAHMANPKVPAVHMNTRMLSTTKTWFGGGADLTPMVPNDQDTAAFHTALQECCERHPGVGDYPAFRDWCDRYFYLPHRKEPRGVGGIFYDALESGSWEADFDFTQDVGKTFKAIYPQLVRQHMFDDFDDADRQHQLERRGRYVEFNLIHDRGTLFGLKTDGNVDAILMSMPPVAAWK